MSDERVSLGRVEGVRAQMAMQAQIAALESLEVELSQEEFQEWGDLAAFNPLAMTNRFTRLEDKVKKGEKGESDTKKVDLKDEKFVRIKRIEEIAKRYEEKNSELHVRSLVSLRNELTKEKSFRQIIRETRSFYHDASLADEALDFLIETTDGDLQTTVKEAKEAFNKEFGREIAAGKNITIEAREFSAQGLGTPTNLRDIYRDITGTQRDSATLFEYLTSKFPFEKLKIVIGFVLHSLGSDLKSKGPSISRAELHRLMTESRSLGAILGVYRFFNTRSKLIEQSFKRSGLPLPQKITFDLLARLFVKFLQERYPNTEKLLLLAKEMDISDEILAEIIIYTQMRDAMRQVAPRLFRTEVHRQDLLKLCIDLLETLDEQLEKEEEEEQEDEKK